MRYKGLRKYTFSAELRAGARRSDWLAGLQIELFGPEVALASPSPKPEPAKASPTSAICGPSSAVSSISAALQSSLESRLQARMDVDGSPEYALTWKRSDMPHGPPICLLRASRRRISDSGSSGQVVGFPTPTSRDWRSDRSRLSGPELYGTKGRPLARVAIDLTGYPTPKASDGNRDPGQATRYLPGGRQRSNLKDAVKYIAGFPTPTVNDSRNGRNATAGRHNPDSKHHSGTTLSDLAFGEAQSGSKDQTPSGGGLNPAFVCWLMGFRIAWESCADMVGRSGPTSRQSSSKKLMVQPETAD